MIGAHVAVCTLVNHRNDVEFSTMIEVFSKIEVAQRPTRPEGHSVVREHHRLKIRISCLELPAKGVECPCYVTGSVKPGRTQGSSVSLRIWVSVSTNPNPELKSRCM